MVWVRSSDFPLPSHLTCQRRPSYSLRIGIFTNTEYDKQSESEWVCMDI